MHHHNALMKPSSHALNGKMQLVSQNCGNPARGSKENSWHSVGVEEAIRIDIAILIFKCDACKRDTQFE